MHLHTEPHARLAATLALATTLLMGAVRVQAQAPPASPLEIWFDEPAASWDHALPVGNGRLGGMVFGGIERERIQLNEETLWSGGPYDPVVKGAYRALPEIRSYLFAGDFVRAHDLFGRTMMGVPYEQMKYQPFADLWLDFPGHGGATDYRRSLDLGDGVARVRYVVDGVTYLREVFSSAVDQVLVIRISADRPGAVTFSAELHGVRNPAHSNYGTDYFRMDGIPPADLRVTGKSSDYLGIEGRLRYEGRIRARVRGGTSEIDYRTLRVQNADEAVLVFAAATSFVDYRDVSADPAARVRDALSRVQDRTWDAMRADHEREHRSWFDRVSLTLGPPAAPGPDLPTDERIARFADHPDPALAALYYQFGRYLLIASSRPGTQPANLQGIWNDNPNPWWDSKYTININLPMNYWPAETGNLPEMVEPLERLTREVAEAGAETAREHWNARGWVLHQNTDLWRSTTPMDGPSWGAWPVGGAWIMTNLWEHYRFGRDAAYLQRIYPLLRGQVRFLLDILVEHPKYGWLVTAPSNSPENFPAWPGNGRFFDEVSGLYLQARTMAVGPTMDMQIIREVFAEFEEAAALLGRDADLADQVRTARARLAPDQVGKHGQLQEWIEDYDEIEPEHRHLSHLWGLYPGREITPASGELARAAAVSLDRRGTGGCGWSYAWKMGRARPAPRRRGGPPSAPGAPRRLVPPEPLLALRPGPPGRRQPRRHGRHRGDAAAVPRWRDPDPPGASLRVVRGERARAPGPRRVHGLRVVGGRVPDRGHARGVGGRALQDIGRRPARRAVRGRAVPLTLTDDGAVAFQAKAGSSYRLTFGG